MVNLTEAVEAIDRGGLVVYPTETVYGLGGDATDIEAIERVFEAKNRPREKPIALAVESIDRAMQYVDVDTTTRAFMHEFLPGPVTVICPKHDVVPDELTGGENRVGVRIPAHETALELLKQTPPLTATSANRTGEQPATAVEDLDQRISGICDVVIDGGHTPGGVSTVVDVNAGIIHRRGHLASKVDNWLDEWERRL